MGGFWVRLDFEQIGSFPPEESWLGPSHDPRIFSQCRPRKQIIRDTQSSESARRKKEEEFEGKVTTKPPSGWAVGAVG